MIGLVQYTGLSTQIPPSLSSWINQTSPGLAFGHLRQRNQLASLCNMGMICLIYLWFQRGRSWPVWIPLMLGGLLCIGSAATHSRIGLLQCSVVLALGAAVVWRAQRKDIAIACLYFLVLYALCSRLLPSIGQTIPGADPLMFPAWGSFSRIGSDSGCEQRIVLWANVIELISVRPWTGWGWGELDYAHYINDYQSGPHKQRFCDILDNAHNLPLQLAVELGLPVCALLLCALLVWVWRSAPWRETSAQRLAAWGILGVIGLHSVVEYPLWYGTFFSAALICLVFLICCFRPVGGSLAVAIPALVLTIFTLYASFDYHRISQIFKPGAQRSAWYADDPLGYADRSWLFKAQVEFAHLSLMPITAENAHQVLELGLRVLHHSPESGVIEKVLAAAQLCGDQATYELHRQRYKAAFAGRYSQWLSRQAETKSPD
jgi:Virulence factor membrane-bound polymerase, C-terminal/O-Antigen ligase/Protein glycosylation ligase